MTRPQLEEDISEGAGYHLEDISKGVLGEVSKIKEEFSEFMDANAQSNSIMELVELSDLLGAVEAYTKENYKISLEELIIMTRATQRAFKSGARQ